MLDPVTETFIQSLEASDVCLFMLDVAEARAHFANLQDPRIPRPEAVIEDVDLPVGPTGTLPVRIVRPNVTQRALPAILFFHGGGWIMGDRFSYDRLIRELAVGCDATLFFVDYTLAPETQFPSQNDEAYEALAYIITNSVRYNIDASRVAVVGDGSGGNMAAATALSASMRCGPTIALQVLFYPILDDVSDNASYRRFSNLATMTAADVAYFFDNYFPNQVSRHRPTAFPLKATIEQLRGVADALIVAGEYDILQYENEAYARKLSKAGVSVSYTCYRGALHGFVTLDALARTQCARAALRQATHSLYEALHLRPYPDR